jgi:hypothetical protein
MGREDRMGATRVWLEFMRQGRVSMQSQVYESM